MLSTQSHTIREGETQYNAASRPYAMSVHRPAPELGAGTGQGVRGDSIMVHHVLIPTSSTVDRGLASRRPVCNHTCRAADAAPRGGNSSARLCNCALDRDNVISEGLRRAGNQGPHPSSSWPWPCSSWWSTGPNPQSLATHAADLQLNGHIEY